MSDLALYIKTLENRLSVMDSRLRRLNSGYLTVSDRTLMDNLTGSRDVAYVIIHELKTLNQGELTDE